jgi:hypothetical protein
MSTYSNYPGDYNSECYGRRNNYNDGPIDIMRESCVTDSDYIEDRVRIHIYDNIWYGNQKTVVFKSKL